MKDFKDKVAVVTGAASGIGRALAERFAAEGMKVVLADIEAEALDRTAEEMKSRGNDVLAVRTDVAKAEEMERLAEKAFATFGKVHVLCNNAGVAAQGAVWERTLGDWEWVIGVNLWAVIHGIRLFVPRMLDQGEEGHVVNTASMAGLTSSPAMATYNVTKHAVVALSETLYHDLALQGAKIGCSVLCPAWVDTKIADSDRNRPEALRNEPGEAESRPADLMLQQAVRQLLATGLSPADVAEHVVKAIRDDRFYVLTHPEWKDRIKTRMENILAERNPTYEPAF